MSQTASQQALLVKSPKQRTLWREWYEVTLQHTLYQDVTSLSAFRQVVAQRSGPMHDDVGFDMVQSRWHAAVLATSSCNP